MIPHVKANDPEEIALGATLIGEGKIGCIVLAGGDGTRLGWNHPKGTFPLSLIRKKTLFEMLQAKVEAVSNYYGRRLPLALMISPLNEKVTKDAFAISSHKPSFFSQNLVALLDENKELLDEIHPNGNGEVLHCFYRSKIFHKWKEEGVQYIQVILIDNPLAEPFDPNLCGRHAKCSADVTLKTVKRADGEERVGVIGVKDGKICVVEYMENPPKEWDLVNTSLFCFSMDFVQKIQDIEMPIHIVQKKLHNQCVYKRECFIFDLLPFSEKTEVLLYPREEIFAPLKNREDVEHVQRALLNRDRKAFQNLTGIEPHEQDFELDAAFHYPSEQLKQKWQGRSLPKTSYIEP